MLATTLDILKSGLRADPTVSPAERARLLALLRQGPEVPRPDAPPSSIDRISAAAKRSPSEAFLAVCGPLGQGRQ